MTPAEILRLYDKELRRDRPSRPTEKMERDKNISRAIIEVPGISFGAILYSDLAGEDVDAIIDAELARFQKRASAFEWKVYGHDEPRDLGDRLVARGFRAGDPETLLCRDLGRIIFSETPAGFEIRKITRVEDLPLLTLDEEPNEAFQHEIARELGEAPDSVSIWIATRDGKPISRGWMRYHENKSFADLWGGRTVKEWRGHGVYKALVAARAKEAAARGVRFVTTDAMPTSRPILQRMDFQALTTTTPYLWVPLT